MLQVTTWAVSVVLKVMHQDALGNLMFHPECQQSAWKVEIVGNPQRKRLEEEISGNL